jgi:hypothetical protein
VRVDDYDFVFRGWQPEGVTLLGAGWSPCIHLGLSYVEFHAVTDADGATVRCDPCSLDQDRTAYTARVRMDLEQVIRKQASVDA